MPENPHSRWTFPIALVLSGLLILLVLGTNFGLANQGRNQVIKEPTSNAPTGWGDDGVYEVGVEWINHFPDPADNRSYWDESCDGLYNRLASIGWKQRFRYTEMGVWETDAKNESLGGQEDTYIDSVDIAMICTHGSGSIYDSFHQMNLSAVGYSTSHTDMHLSPGDAYIGYGDKDLEYLAFDSCKVLNDASFIYWASTFNGLHLLLGFSSHMHVDPYGDGFLWGYFMTSPYPMSVTQAWFTAIDFNQPSDVCARVIGESASNYNERWWNTSPDPIVDSEKVVWDHCSHGIIYGLNNRQQPEVITVPILQVQDRTVNEDYVRYTIAPAFNITGTIGLDDMFYYMANTGDGITLTLLVDPITGSYSFHNLSNLWSTPVITPTLPDERLSIQRVEEWFSQTPAEGLPGANYRNSGYFYDTEQIFSELLKQPENGVLQAQETSSLPTDVSMTYPRTITALSGTTNGTQLVNYPIFGPGARTVVYLGDEGEIIGAQGGSRDAQVMADVVEILDPNEVWSRFLANRNLAIGEIPFQADTITHTVPLLGYYEMPYFVHQDEFIPVWEFRGYFYLDENLVAEDYPVYLPASSYYLPPEVAITNPIDGDTFWANDQITFVSSVTGGKPPYTYEWTSSSDGFLGNTPNIVSAIGSEIKNGTALNPTVSFQVTDANGLTSTATISLKIKPVFWLPYINR